MWIHFLVICIFQMNHIDNMENLIKYFNSSTKGHQELYTPFFSGHREEIYVDKIKRTHII